MPVTEIRGILNTHWRYVPVTRTTSTWYLYQYGDCHITVSGYGTSTRVDRCHTESQCFKPRRRSILLCATVHSFY